MQVEDTTVFRLQIVAETDPGALVRTLQFFQARNLVPRQVSAQRVSASLFNIVIDVESASCTRETFSMIAAKLNELPIVLDVVVCD